MKWLAMTLFLGISAPQVAAQSIGVFADSMGTDCNLIIPFPGGPVTAYVVGRIDGAAAVGVAGAAFRIAGLPEGWSGSVTSFGPDVTAVFGNPFAEGVLVGQGRCTAGTRMLFAVAITPTSSVENVSLGVLPHMNADYHGCGFEGELCPQACPRFCGCVIFNFRCYCAESAPASINGSLCFVETQEWSWGKIKSTFR